MRSAANILWIAISVILSFASERVQGFLGSPQQQQQQWVAQRESERRSRSFTESNPRAAATTKSSIALLILRGEATSTSSSTASGVPISCSIDSESRRKWLFRSIGASAIAAGTLAISSRSARGNDFAPGGTLVDYKVGVTVGNPEASPTRKPDNSNVLFDRDFYFKFGTAAPWISPGSSDFPKTIPFVKSQQRYDALKKYQDRILLGVANIQALENADPSAIADPTAVDVYYLRPMGLLANALLASENTGSTNELHLARWYINEILLHIVDLRNNTLPDNDGKSASYAALRKAMNSYICLMNRAITEKVGNKFDYI